MNYLFGSLPLGALLHKAWRISDAPATGIEDPQKVGGIHVLRSAIHEEVLGGCPTQHRVAPGQHGPDPSHCEGK